MRRAISSAESLTFVILILSVFAVQTAAQETPPPELQRLNFFVGEWSYDNGTTEVFEWLGDHFLESTEVQTDTSGNTRTIEWLYGYDPVEELYTLHGFRSDGWRYAAKGWVHDDTWTWILDEPASNRIRYMIVEESPTSYIVKWARSIEGGNWEESPNEIRVTKVR